MLQLVGLLFPHINDDARSNSHQVNIYILEIRRTAEVIHFGPSSAPE